MSYKAKQLPQSQVEFTITVVPEDYQKDLQKAAVTLSQRASIKGFRKGKAPFEMVKKELGEMAIMQEALETIVQSSFYAAVKAENIETIGMPKIEIEKLAPENEIVYKATVALIPEVTLADVNKIKVKKETKDVSEDDITETLDAVRGMHANEVEKEESATKTDKVIVDMDMLIDNVPIDGGQALDHQVYLSEKHYIPGFAEKLIGVKKNDEKTFSLEFDKDHFQKQLAGKKVDFKVKVKGVYERQLPELSDELAKKLGQDSLDELKKLIRSNMEAEAKQRADQKAEIEMLDQLIEKSTFSDIPEVIIDAERQKMFYELKADLEKNGIEISDYLGNMKKTEEELFNDFKEQATKRAKASLVSRQIAIQENITVSDEDIDGEIAMMKEMYKHNKETLDKIDRPEIRDTIASSLQNRKVMTWLKAKVLGTEMVKSGKIEKSDCCDDPKHDHKK